MSLLLAVQHQLPLHLQHFQLALPYSRVLRSVLMLKQVFTENIVKTRLAQ
jgi:hypothetical protein